MYEKRFDAPLKQSDLAIWNRHSPHTPISQTDKSRLHQFGNKMLTDNFKGHALHTGGGGTGYWLIAEWVEIAQNVMSKDKIRLTEALGIGHPISTAQLPWPKVGVVRHWEERLVHWYTRSKPTKNNRSTGETGKAH